MRINILMNFRAFAMLALLGPGVAMGQFVWPKAEYHVHSANDYQEDPFITKYRAKFFGVFRGDFRSFEEAYKEIQDMVAKNPRDARALVWLGNGQTVKGTLSFRTGKPAEGLKLLEESRKTMRRAVALRPEDYGIYMMEAATLYVEGQYVPDKYVPASAWATLRDDCLHLLRSLGPKIDRVSIHVRGETYGELAVAYEKLGDKAQARRYFSRLVKSDPGTLYAEKAQSELGRLGG